MKIYVIWVCWISLFISAGSSGLLFLLVASIDPQVEHTCVTCHNQEEPTQIVSESIADTLEEAHTFSDPSSKESGEVEGDHPERITTLEKVEERDDSNETTVTKNNTELPVVIVVRAEQKFSSQILIENNKLKEEEIEIGSPVHIVLNDSKVERTISVNASKERDAEDPDLSADVNDNAAASHEDIPSFSEWAQKRLEEAEKKKIQPNASLQTFTSTGGNADASPSSTIPLNPLTSSSPTLTANRTSTRTSLKIRSKNYASPDCGAKVLIANPESRSAKNILVTTRDEYMLNTCTTRIWFIVELCEPIQAKKIDLANFELFSSSPKDFIVYVTDRYPTRDWTVVGQFTARDERDVQSFTLNPRLFGKFIKVEMLTHYGTEHFCPISLFRAYGTSEFEVLETETENQSSTVPEISPNTPLDDDDDNDDDDDDDDSANNLFGSARDAVINIVKKAAQVLRKSDKNGNDTDKSDDLTFDGGNRFRKDNSNDHCHCQTPRYNVLCDNCTKDEFNSVFRLISCKYNELEQFLNCAWIKFNFTNCLTDNHCSHSRFFNMDYLIALCNVFLMNNHRSTVNSSLEIEMSNYTNGAGRDELKFGEGNTLDDDNGIVLVDDGIVNFVNESRDNCSVGGEGNVTVNVDGAALNDTFGIGGIIDGESGQNFTNTEEELAIEFEETINFDTLFSDLKDLENDTGGGNLQPVVTVPTTTATATTVQKESVFLRLSNRIKTLERNMSLSGQYLEELSRRYKKQVEEIQRSLEKAISIISESKKLEERDSKTQEELRILKEEMNSIKQSLEMLLHSKDDWSSKILYVLKKCLLICIEVGLVIVIFLYYRKTIVDTPESIEARRKKENLPLLRRPIRRKSTMSVVAPTNQTNNFKKAKKRRPSEIASNTITSTSSSYNDFFILVDEESKKVKKRKERTYIEDLKMIINDTPTFMKTAVGSRRIRQDMIFNGGGETSQNSLVTVNNGLNNSDHPHELNLRRERKK